ncbi:MAG: flavodoxin family protein, partial [Armatimonadetes bacterium]|nr:flavodoxin family protein [Armatimonadota bacterium]
MTKVVLLCASPRKGGNTDLMADAFGSGASAAGAKVEKIYLDDYVIRPVAHLADDPAMRVDLRADDDMPKLLDKVLVADVVLFASPVYWAGVAGQLKCFMDRWSCYAGQERFKEAMRRKVYAVVTAHGSPLREMGDWVIAPLRDTAVYLGGRYAGEVNFAGAKYGAVAAH